MRRRDKREQQGFNVKEDQTSFYPCMVLLLEKDVRSG